MTTKRSLVYRVSKTWHKFAYRWRFGREAARREAQGHPFGDGIGGERG